MHAILAGFPAGAAAADAELAAVAAADELAQGSLEAAERYLEVAARGATSVPAARRERAQALLGIIRLLIARHRGNPPAVAEEARRLQATAEAPEAAPGLGEELRALALISLGSAEYGAARIEDAAAHLEQGAVLASRAGRPYLEFTSLAYQAQVELERSFERAAERGRQAVELAERHGWTDERPPEAPTSHLQARCSARGGLMRQSPGFSGPSAPSCRTPSPPWGRGSASCAGCWSWRAAASPTRWPPAGPPSGLRGTSPPRTAVTSTMSTGDCGSRPGAPGAIDRADRPWAACVTRTDRGETRVAEAALRWPKTTRARQPPRWHRFWTAPTRGLA